MATPETPFPTPNVEGPDHYVHGSVNAQIIYWKRRAESAEARCLRLEEDLATLRRSQAKP